MGRKAAIKRGRKQDGALRQREEQRAAEALRQTFARQGRESIPTPQDESKISVVFSAFAAPLLRALDRDGPAPLDRVRSTLLLAQVVWDAALCADESQEVVTRLTDELFGTLPPRERDEGRWMISTLVERRRTEFAHDRRVIVEFHADRGSDGGLRLAVACAPASTNRRGPS